jgi:hypothetical protein
MVFLKKQQQQQQQQQHDRGPAGWVVHNAHTLHHNTHQT